MFMLAEEKYLKIRVYRYHEIVVIPKDLFIDFAK